MYKAVIFDLDGTLLDTLGDLHASVNYALIKHGMPKRSLDEVRSFVGNGVRRLIERAVPNGTNDITEILADFKEHYGAHCRDLTAPYDGIIAALDELNASGIKTAVVSNKIDSAVKTLCREYFGNRISAAVGDIDGRPTKPSPEPVIAALDELGISAKDAVYIGDSDVDVFTAKNCHMPVIAVTWGFRSRDVLANAGASIICDTPKEMLAAILK